MISLLQNRLQSRLPTAEHQDGNHRTLLRTFALNAKHAQKEPNSRIFIGKYKCMTNIMVMLTFFLVNAACPTRDSRPIRDSLK